MASWLKILIGVLVLAVILFYGIRFFVGSSQSVSAEKLVEQAIKEPEVAKQRQAVAALVALPEPVRLEPLRRLSQESTSPPVVATAVLTLAGQWDYGSMPRTLELLDDPSPEVRTAAAFAAQRMMSVNFQYRATDPPEQREAAAARLRKHWEWFRDSPRLKWWKERLKNGQLKGNLTPAN